MNPLQYAQKAILVNEFTGGVLSTACCLQCSELITVPYMWEYVYSYQCLPRCIICRIAVYDNRCLA